MPMIVVVGAQWGDEGKGKIVDLYAENAEVVARYNGGANAGHTSYVNGIKYVTHLLPSGILQGKVCVLGAGMVIDPKQLLEEIAEFAGKEMNVSSERIMISPAAHIVLPTHKALDGAHDNARGRDALGTTKRGIGPAYADKALRRGLRAGAMLSPPEFGRFVYELTRMHNRELAMLGGAPMNPSQTAAEYQEYAEKLKEYVQDTSIYLHQCLKDGKVVLAEGAQGTLLDVDHGGYPFVSSSATVAGGASTGLGVGPMHITKIIGVAKCFQTRVGAGPMPTEIDYREEKLLNYLRGDKNQPGAEYGATTGRSRRIGWLDIPLLKYAVRINGCTELVLTKLDVLSGLESLKLCVAYKNKAKIYRELPDDAITDLECYAPVYEEMMGWLVNLGRARTFEDLSVFAQPYVRKIEELTGVPVSLISVGTDRNQVIRCEKK